MGGVPKKAGGGAMKAAAVYKQKGVAGALSNGGGGLEVVIDAQGEAGEHAADEQAR